MYTHVYTHKTGLDFWRTLTGTVRYALKVVLPPIHDSFIEKMFEESLLSIFCYQLILILLQMSSVFTQKNPTDCP